LAQESQIPIKNRFLELQQIDDVDAISESEVSHEINVEPEISEDISNLVRTVSRNAAITIGNIAVETSLEQISSSLVLLHHFTQSSPSGESVKIIETKSEESPPSPCILLHSGKLVRRCGDCMSSIISSKILKRYKLILESQHF
jgi:hypothetical protein